ncbi:MAG TPA: zinc-dependent alcohol dehydrogenase [Candidatus Acidoferrales bacterium]|nr:zinc-dependent alcohol dehydrogenase [Candidatus Acidoferrales bacterium]
MRAAILHEFGQPLSLEDVPIPVAGDGEVLLQIEACGVCHSDLHLVSGDWPAFAKLIRRPLIPGHEIVGRVMEVGAGVSANLRDTRVGVPWVFWSCGTCSNCLEGRENICQNRAITGVTVNGGYAEFMVAKASHVISIPESLSSVEAAPLFCAGVTVYRALRNAEVKPGQRVAIFGIGGLGHLAVQVARAMGAEVVAVDVDDAKLALARESGAQQTLNSVKKDAAAELRASGGVHLALVATPAKSAYDAAFTVPRAGGAVMIVGLPYELLTFDAVKLARNEARILTSVVGTRQDVRDTLALAAAGKLHCKVESRPLAQINEILDSMRRGGLLGRMVLVPTLEKM